MTKKAIKGTKPRSKPEATDRSGSLSSPIYNSKGEIVGKISLPKEIFNEKSNPFLVAQAVRVYLDRQKPKLASTKTRSEVAGGGRKPYRQKGTGRARAGSIRAPHWRGGGVVFGPKPRETHLSLSQKMRQKALAAALSDKLREQGVVVLDKIDIKEPRTTKAATILEMLPLKDRRSPLLVLGELKEALVKSFRNIPKVDFTRSVDLNAVSVVKSSGLIFTVDSVEKLKERFERQTNHDQKASS